MSESSRRRFLAASALTAGAITSASSFMRAEPTEAAKEPDSGTPASDFVADWADQADRIWIGPCFWANPLYSWKLTDGGVETTEATLDRRLHLLTRDLANTGGSVTISMRVSRPGGGPLLDRTGAIGFRVGIEGRLPDPRARILSNQGPGFGLTGNGRLFFNGAADRSARLPDSDRASVDLTLTISGDTERSSATLTATDIETGETLAMLQRDDLPTAQLAGGMAVIANPASLCRGGPRRGGRETDDRSKIPGGRFRIENLRLSGDRLTVHDDRAFGPVLLTSYTVHQDTLRLSVQLPPLEPTGPARASLTLIQGGRKLVVPEMIAEADARNVVFVVGDWDDQAEASFTVTTSLPRRDGSAKTYTYSGLIRRNPKDQPTLTVADISCNIHTAFPNDAYVQSCQAMNPDLMLFTGDQFYESTGGYGIVRTPVETAVLDYLHKWMIHAWTWHDVTRDRPSIAIPDDHDIYQGNYWGGGGEPQGATQESGGYQMDVRWVNVVHQTQTAHHPPSPHPGLAKRGMTVYYGPLTWGGVSFAILTDRMFKTGPEGRVPPTGSRGDHVIDSKFDPASADLPGLELLGPEQTAFLKSWLTDFDHAEIKAVVSQTIFTGMATHHGPEKQRLYADYDTNAWPQSARNHAVDLIRRAGAVHLAGDQHLPAVVRYGIEKHDDAGFAYAGPAVNVGYPRWWEPDDYNAVRDHAAEDSPPVEGAPPIEDRPGDDQGADDPRRRAGVGRYRDAFGHPMTVVAYQNPDLGGGGSLIEQTRARASGLGLVQFHKDRRQITITCYAYGLAPGDQEPEQFRGWPVTIDVPDAGWRGEPIGYLPRLEVVGAERPVFAVYHVDLPPGMKPDAWIGLDIRGQVPEYVTRPLSAQFLPPVYRDGVYVVEISEPETRRMTRVVGLTSGGDQQTALRIELS